MNMDQALETMELLVIFMEECAEASVEASKVIRFASDTSTSIPPLEREVGDLLCMVELLKEYNLINSEAVEKAKEAKREKLKKWSNLNV